MVVCEDPLGLPTVVLDPTSRPRADGFRWDWEAFRRRLDQVSVSMNVTCLKFCHVVFARDSLSFSSGVFKKKMSFDTFSGVVNATLARLGYSILVRRPQPLVQAAAQRLIKTGTCSPCPIIRARRSTPTKTVNSSSQSIFLSRPRSYRSVLLLHQ